MNKTKFLSLTASLVLATTLTAVAAPPPKTAEKTVPDKRETFTDSRDGKVYKKVTIGTQTWMAENLNYKAEGSVCYGENGEVVISREESDAEFNVVTKTLSPAEVQANCDKYSRLYDWKTALKACPSGWHLPSKAEWEVLDKAVGGEKVAGKKLKSSSGWNDDEGNSGNGTDEFGFSALPGGGGCPGGYFDGNKGIWWTATEYDSNGACIRIMGYYDFTGWGNSSGDCLVFSVRCVQD